MTSTEKQALRDGVARALRSLASLVAGDDPAALAIAEAARARAEAERAVDLARLALTSAERAVDGDAVTMEMALRTRGVVGAMLREGIGRAEAGLPSAEVAAVHPRLVDAAGVCEQRAQTQDRLAAASPPGERLSRAWAADELRYVADRIRALAGGP